MVRLSPAEPLVDAWHQPIRGGTVCVALLPAAGSEARRLRRRLLRQARRHGGDRARLLERLADDPRDSRTPPAELAERRAEGRALDAKQPLGRPRPTSQRSERPWARQLGSDSGWTAAVPLLSERVGTFALRLR